MISDQIKTGVDRAPHRSLLYALGLTEEELRTAEASPVFNFLPFAPKEVMVGILHDSYQF